MDNSLEDVIYNDRIKAKEVMVIGENGENLGVLSRDKALNMAYDLGLDLVMVGEGTTPVCKITNYGKHKYKTQKKLQESKRKSKQVELKEVRFSSNIGENDYQTKLRNIMKFVEEGCKVKVQLRFRGREIMHVDVGMKVAERVKNDLQDKAKIEQDPKLEDRTITMFIGSLVKK